MYFQGFCANLAPAQNFNETYGWTNGNTVDQHQNQGNNPSMYWPQNVMQGNVIGNGADQGFQNNQFNQGPIMPFNDYNDPHSGYFNDYQGPPFKSRRTPTPKPKMNSCGLPPKPKANILKWIESFLK